MSALTSKLEKIENILAAFDLKKTPLRKQMLFELMSSDEALTQADLIQRLSKTLRVVDRVTLYRNLNQLKELGVVHEVEINSYILCEHDCHKHPHLLLFCQQCHRHEEMKDHHRIHSVLEALDKIKFFAKTESLSISMRGICSSCSG